MTVESRLNAETQWLSVADGADIAYWSAGSGSPLIFVPGWSVTGSFFYRQFNHFVATNRVITFDPRGQGRSRKTLAQHGIGQRAEDLAELIEKLDLQDVTLIGWSAGALDCVAYAQSHGHDRLKAVMLVDQAPAGVAADDGSWGDFPLDQLPALMGMFEQDVAGFRAMSLAQWLGEDHPNFDWLLSEMSMTPASVAIQTGFSVIATDLSDAYRNLIRSLPSRLVVSAQNEQLARQFLNGVDGPSLSAFGDHAMMVTHSDRFNEELAALLVS
jgi:non-heme chloroperoxidase